MSQPSPALVCNVRDFGAVGDGRTLDSPAINRAIEAASQAGGGVVMLPAGTYLSFSIRLRSHLTLQFQPGATLLAATPHRDGGTYDAAEPNEWGDRQYQDFGHSHWHDALIWGEHLEHVAIVGPGLIHGQGLSHGLEPKPATSGGPAPIEAGPNGTLAPVTEPAPAQTHEPGPGYKAIALKRCRHVTLRDFSMLRAGWFAVLATGVDHLTIDNLRIDTNRDGLDLDSCRHVRIAHCAINTPHDDAIVLKSSYALGTARACENITIANCQVSGFDLGTFLDGTCGRTGWKAPDQDGPCGRIKFGTESNGGYRNVVISNCVFLRSRGLAFETVDGGALEDVSVTNIVMREVSNAPLFFRIGNRGRGPAGLPIGAIRRVSLSHITVSDCDARYPILIAGLPGHPVEQLRLHDIHVTFRGGLSLDDAARQPAELINPFFLRDPAVAQPRDPYEPPEQERAYPEPSMFGILPAYGLFVRHARQVTIDGLTLAHTLPDSRPPVVVMDAENITLDGLDAQRDETGLTVVLRRVRGFRARRGRDLPDLNLAHADAELIVSP